MTGDPQPPVVDNLRVGRLHVRHGIESKSVVCSWSLLSLSAAVLYTRRHYEPAPPGHRSRSRLQTAVRARAKEPEDSPSVAGRRPRARRARAPTSEHTAASCVQCVLRRAPWALLAGRRSGACARTSAIHGHSGHCRVHGTSYICAFVCSGGGAGAVRPPRSSTCCVLRPTDSLSLGSTCAGITMSASSFLRVEGTRIVDGSGQEVILRGAGLGGWMT